MPLKITRGKNLPIGVDLGTSSMKLAQVRETDSGYELLAWESHLVPVACRENTHERMAFVGEKLRGIIKSKTFRGRQCVLSLPAELTFVHHLKMPVLDDREMAGALRAELRGKVPYDVDEAVVRHVVAGQIPGDAENRQEVIAVCADRDVLESHLTMSRRAKLDVVSINIEPCAVVECFSRMFRRDSDSNRTILFIDIGIKSTQVVLSHGPQIAFARNLEIGGDDLDQAVAEKMQVSLEQARSLRREIIRTQADQAENDAPDGGRDDDDGAADNGDAEKLYSLLDDSLDTLGGELSTCLRYYESVFRGRAIERAIFLGGQAYDKHLCQSLAQRLNLPAQIGDPLVRIKRLDPPENVSLAQEPSRPKPDWAVAIGLSVGTTKAA